MKFFSALEHGAAPALAAAGGFAEKLGHNGLAVQAPGQGLAVVPVVGDDVILGLQVGNGPHGNGFFATVNVEEPLDIPPGVLALRLSLELPDQLHLVVKFQELCLAVLSLVHRCHRLSVRLN